MNFYKQYLEVKKQYPDALVFYRVGDFYELFGADAITASEALSLTLTGRDCGLAERVPMCGVPYHSIDIYIKKLIENGLKTAVCEPAPPETHSKLNLTAIGMEQTILLEYLEANASDILIEKINNGVKIIKDGKTLVSKKTLETFLAYACEEARKIAEKGAKAAAVKSDTVFGWLIHYFEESSIEGTLYNEDGSEYKPPKPVSKIYTTKTAAATVGTLTKEKPKAQFSLFDMLDTKAEEKPENEETEIDTDKPESDESETVTEEMADEEDYPKGLHQVSETEWADEDGVIYEESKREPANTNDTIPSVLVSIFGDTLILR